jgi:hypothetical protein
MINFLFSITISCVFYFSFGYKPFIQAVDKQSKLLQKISEQAPPTVRIKRLSTSSTESANPTDLSSQHIEREVPPVVPEQTNSNSPNDAAEKLERSRYDCRVS